MTITINGLEISQSITSITKFQKEKVLFESTGDSVLWQLIKTPISNNDSTYYEKWANSKDIDSTLAPEELVLNIAGSYKIKIEETTSGVIRRHLVVIEAESLKDNTVLPFTGESTETNSTDGWSRKVEKSLQTLSQNEGSFSVVAIADTDGEEYSVGELAILSGLKYTKSSGFIYEIEKPEGDADPESRGYIGIVLDKKSTGGGITFDDDYSNIYNVAFKGAFKLTEELSPFGTTPLGMQMVYYDRTTFKLTKSPTDYYIGKYFYNNPEDIVLIIENPIFFNYKYSVLVTDWALPEPSHTNIPSEKLVKDNLDLKQDKHLVTDWTLPAPLHTNYPSELLVKTELNKKQINNLITEWSIPDPSDEKYPSEALVKDEIDLKQNISNLITEWSTPDPSDEKYPSEALILKTFQQLSEKVVSWSATPNNDNYPSEKLVKDCLDILYSQYTTKDVVFDISVYGIDALQTYFDNLKHNDYNITVTGNYDDNSTIFYLNDISGSGVITFNGNFTLGGLQIKNVTNNVIFPYGATYALNIEQTTTHGLNVINCPYVYIDTLNSTFESAPALSTWTLVNLINSKLTIKLPNFDGSFTSDSTPTHLIRLDGKSQLFITNDYTVTTNAIEGTSIGRSIIKVEDGGFISVTATPTFTNWSKNFACQFEMVKYDKAPFIYYMSIGEDSLIYINTIISNINTINGNVKLILPFHVFGSYQEIQDFKIENINGCGNLYIEYAEFVSNNIINNCNITLSIYDCKIDDSNVSGEYGISIVNCKDVVFESQTILNAGSKSYDALLINNSNVVFDVLRYLNDPDVAFTNYLTIRNNSNVHCSSIVSGAGDTTESIFITVLDGSKFSVDNWLSGHVLTTKLKFNSISNGAYVIGYTNTGYKLALMQTDITIITKP